MKKESLIGFCLFASFLYGINNILKITFNVKDKPKSEEQSETNDNKQQTETGELLLEKVGSKPSKTNYDLDKIDILINEINIIEFEDKELLLEKVGPTPSKIKVDDEKVDILDSDMIRTIENEREFRVFTINNMIDKKKYLIELNDKLTDIKTSLTNLKNEMEFCNSSTFYL